MNGQNFEINNLRIASPEFTNRNAARFAGAALIAILGLFSASFGQKTDENSMPDSKVKIVRSVNRKNIVTGTIVDPNDGHIPGAEITLFRGKKIIKKARGTDDGGFSFSSLTTGNYSLRVMAPNFKTRTVEFEINKSEPRRVEMTIKLDIGDIVSPVFVEN